MLNQTKRVQMIFETETLSARFAIPGAVRTRREGVVLNAIVHWTNGSEPEVLRASTDARIQIFPVGLEEIFMEFFGNENPNAVEPKNIPSLYATC